MNHIDHIQQAIASTLPNEYETGEVVLTSDFSHGDYTSNVALVNSVRAGKSPREIAEEIVKKLNESNGLEFIDSIAVAGPGFINFTLKDASIIHSVKQAYGNSEQYARTHVFEGKEVLIEYTQPNPLKVFHIGHLMSNAIGESLSRLYEAGGATVKRLNYQGDVGLHIGKALWGMKQLVHEMPVEHFPLNERTAWLGRAYVAGATAYEENEIAKEEIHALNKAVYDNDTSVADMYETGKRWSLDHFEEIYRILGTVFDRYYFESETSPIGLKAVMDNTPRVFKESDGAIIYPGDEEGLHTRVFVTSRGLPAYEAKDLGLCILKNEEYPDADISIVVTAEEQREYMRVVKAAVAKIIPHFADKFVHVTHGMMNLATGKMSSRKGNVVSGESMIYEAIDRVKAVMQERGYEDDERDAIARSVAVAAVKFPILRQALGKNIAFDLDTSLSLEGDTGAYIQYARVRALSVIDKARQQGIEAIAESEHDVPRDLERLIGRFPHAIERAQYEREPHHIATFLISLAQAWNSYYGATPILGKPTTPYRLMLAQATAGCIEQGMKLLGMTVPSRM